MFAKVVLAALAAAILFVIVVGASVPAVASVSGGTPRPTGAPPTPSPTATLRPTPTATPHAPAPAREGDEVVIYLPFITVGR